MWGVVKGMYAFKINMNQPDYYNKTAISTREKFGSLAKKVLRYLYESRTKILKFPELLQ